MTERELNKKIKGFAELKKEVESVNYQKEALERLEDYIEGEDTIVKMRVEFVFGYLNIWEFNIYGPAFVKQLFDIIRSSVKEEIVRINRRLETFK